MTLAEVLWNVVRFHKEYVLNLIVESRKGAMG